MTEEIKIKLQNCNNIEQAEIVIQKNSLNIKYGPNGLGKSTIAKAIIASTEDDGVSLQKLMPFKKRNEPEPNVPSIEGADSIKNPKIFDDEYVKQFVFKQSEVLDGSFDIFIRTDEYETATKEIEELFKDIKQAFKENDAIEEAISDLTILRNSSSFTAKGDLAKSSQIYKAVGKGNKIKNIPDEFLPFEAFLNSDKPADWITWQKKGNDFLDLSENCPYCSLDISGEGKKEMLKKVSNEYASKGVEHLASLQSAIGKLNKYFTLDCNEKLLQVIEGKTEITLEGQAFIKKLSIDISTLIQKLESLKNISSLTLIDMDVEEIEKHFKDLVIDLKMIDMMDSEETKNVVDPINSKLNELIGQIQELKIKINKQKSRIRKTIQKNQNQINDFLQIAGYKYEVKVAKEDSYKMKLIHLDDTKHIENASEHLSYGEKNAFALILFMYQAISEKRDLIILDDPISSFDKNKKFAILFELFKGEQNFKGMTVLMLTHDIEPVIDIIRVNDRFQGLNPSASFLSSSNGVIKERKISREDIQTFAKICTQNIEDADNDIIKVIYLRRYYEILDNFGAEYNLLSSLLHGRDKPTIRPYDRAEEEMTDTEIEDTESNIKEYIHNFQYFEVLSQIQNKQQIVEMFNSAISRDEKVQLFRIAYEDYKENVDDVVFNKFINKAFHIENEYIMQLNPQKFDSVPEYIIDLCEEKLKSMNLE